MRKILAALLALTTLSASAQQTAQQPAQPPAGSNWQHVQALPVGASINVKARTSHASCTLKSVSADSLTCTHGKDIVIQRSDILTIQISRRGRSTLIAMGIGAGAGAIVGAATSGCSATEKNSFLGCFLTPTRPQGAAIGAVLFGVIGAPIGALTDFAKSTIYQAP
ncbi:MAG: hypothetical protein ABSF57_03680 [Acidobacteriaceae bacterium]|jgi:hypothetical protein